MPRATSSLESRILSYFRTAPLATALVVLGLVKEVVAERSPKTVVKKRKRRTAAELIAAGLKEAPAAPAPAPAPSTPKKSHHKAKGRHTKPLVESEVESFDA